MTTANALSNGSAPVSGGGRLTVETPFVGDVVHEEDSHRAPVVRRRDRPEPLLSRRVPLCVTPEHCSQLSLRQTWARAAKWEEQAGGTHNLELDALAVEFDGTDLEVDTDGGDKARSPGIVAEPEEQARLADAWWVEEIRQRVARVAS